MVCILLTIAVALAPATRRYDWLFGLLALIAMLGLELGVLIVPLSIVLWWFGAPGIGRRGVLSVAAGAVVYLVVRLTFAEYSGESLYATPGSFSRPLTPLRCAPASATRPGCCGSTTSEARS